MAVSSVPISTPKPMSRPTSAIMSPKPCTKVPIVSSNPSPAATPRYSVPITREITGSTLATTISNTITIIAIAVCSTIKVSLIVLSFRAHHACRGRRVGVQQVVAPSPVPTELLYRIGHGPLISPIPGCILCSLNEGVKVTCCRSGLRKSSSPWLQRAAGNRTTPSVSDLWSTASTSEAGTRIDPYACRCRWALVIDTQHQDRNVVTGVLLLEVQNCTLYSAGHSRSV